MARKKKQMNWRPVIGTALTAMVIGLSWLSFHWSAYTGLNLLANIEIRGPRIIQETEYYASLSPLLDVSLDEIDVREIGMLLESHPFVHAARVCKIFPASLQIDIVERDPIALLNLKPILYTKSACQFGQKTFP